MDGNILETDYKYSKYRVFILRFPEGNKRGLSIETVLPNVGDIMLFDAEGQIHASCVKHIQTNYKWLHCIKTVIV